MRAERRAYQAPKLSVLGEVRALTESGSMTNTEDNNPGHMGAGCHTISGHSNTTGMC